MRKITKRTILVISLSIAGVLCFILPFLILAAIFGDETQGVGIIGGADYPSLWFFLFERLGALTLILWGSAGVLLVVALLLWVRGRKSKNRQ